MIYDLYHENQMIATVEEEASDFPSFFGRYELAPTVNAPELACVRSYIDYSVRVWPLIEQDRWDEIDLSEERTFANLIESAHWSLVETQTRKRIPILIPVFCANGRINWRLNPSHKPNENP